MQPTTTFTTSQATGHPLPSWITEALIERTICVWQPHSSEPITREDALAILKNVGRLCDVLEQHKEPNRLATESSGPSLRPPARLRAEG
jgi:hypothetical protein